MKTAYSVEVKHNMYSIVRKNKRCLIFMDEGLINVGHTMRDALELLCNILTKRLNDN